MRQFVTIRFTIPKDSPNARNATKPKEYLAPLAHFSHVDDKPFARNIIMLTRPRGVFSHTVTVNSGEIVEMFQKTTQRSWLQAPPCIWINIILLLSDPRLSQKSLLWRSFFFRCWMNLLYNNERASQHRNFTFIKKRVLVPCFYFSRSFFINLWDFLRFNFFFSPLIHNFFLNWKPQELCCTKMLLHKTKTSTQNTILFFFTVLSFWTILLIKNT